jgi:hypothetical protein
MRVVPNKIIMLFVALFMLPIYTFSAPPPPPPGTVPPPPGSPIDGGLMILLLISLAFGIYKIYISNIKKASN